MAASGAKGPEVTRTARRLGQRLGYRESLLAIGRHLGRAGRSAEVGISPAAAVFLDDARPPFEIAPRLPGRWLHHHLDAIIGEDDEKAEAKEATKFLHARVALSAPPPPGGGDGEPDLVAEGRAINALKHKLKREALLQFANDDALSRVSGNGDEIAAADLSLHLQAEAFEMPFDGSIKVCFQVGSFLRRIRAKLARLG